MASVLLVDDDRDFTLAHKAILEKGGHRVAVAYSGQEGWEALQKALPDLLVLDCMMETFTSGFELAQDVASRYPRLPMIMLTAVHDHMSAAWKWGPGDEKWLPIHKWMEKPVQPAQLQAAVDELLRTAGAGKA